MKLLQKELIAEAVKEGEADYRQARSKMFGLLAAMAAAGMLLAWRITRSITTPNPQHGGRGPARSPR